MAMTKKERYEYNTKRRRTKDGVVNRLYDSQKSSSKRRGHIMPTYSREEFREWLYSQTLFHVLYDNFKRLDYQSLYKPSVDRIDSKIGYTMANVQLMTWGENKEKSKTEQNPGSSNGMSKSKEYYNTNPTCRNDFKNKICKRQGWNFLEFEQTFSGITSTGGKKFYHKFIGDEKC